MERIEIEKYCEINECFISVYIGYICEKEYIFPLGLIDAGNVIYWDKAN